MKISRRKFITRAGASAAGVILAPYLKMSGGPATGAGSNRSYVSQVALTRAAIYDRTFVKQRVQHLFDSLGGITDLMQAGKKVAIKINLTGGSGSALSPKLNGLPITESMWSHPEVVRAVGELILDCGVRGSDIYFVESLWDGASFDNFGYRQIQQALGAQLINLNNKDPYPAFVEKSVGPNKFYYTSFTVNQILADVDVYVSIPKMKEHYEAGVTASLKNQVGMVPKQLYVIPSDQGRRAKLHAEDGGSSTAHLPRSICDLALARPVHLAVIDGIKNARGGEGVWNPTFRLAEDHVLLAGKEPVSADSVAAFLMGHNPEAPTIALPSGGQCDNYLDLLHQKGVGTNQIAEIKAVGDGADLLTSVEYRREPVQPTEYDLCQNYPNPFNPSTTIRFSLPTPESVTVRVFSVTGQAIETLLEGRLEGGIHDVRWTPVGIASGVYFCELQAGKFVDRRKMIYQK
jgi:uncharacterized protein (DUF362 family)